MGEVKTVGDHQTGQTGIVRRVALGAGIGMDRIVRVCSGATPSLHGVMYPVYRFPRRCAGSRVDGSLCMTSQTEACKLGVSLGNLS